MIWTQEEEIEVRGVLKWLRGKTVKTGVHRSPQRYGHCSHFHGSHMD